MTMLRPPGTQAARQEQLAAAYRHCAAIAAHHGKSYHLATRLLTADRRPAVHALYAGARTADDLVDLPGPDPAGDLAEWSRAVLAGSSVQPGVGVPMVLISGRLAAERITGPVPR